MNIYEQIARNRQLTWTVVLVFVAFFLFIGAIFDMLYTGVPFFSVIALLIACFSSYMSYKYGDKMVLAVCRARPLDLNDPVQRQWQNVVEEVAIAAGIPAPATYIIDDDDPNAFATGRDPHQSSIAVTRGLLEKLNRQEQQGVAAHEISHIRNYDIRLMLIISVLVGAIALISDWASRSLFRSRRQSSKREDSTAIVLLAIWLITVILAPLISQMLAMFVSRRREYLADASGAEIIRNPIALAEALEKIDRAVNLRLQATMAMRTSGLPTPKAAAWVCGRVGYLSCSPHILQWH